MRPAALQSLAYVVGPDLVQQMCLYVIPLAQQQEDKPVMHQVSPGGGSAPGVCPSWLGELRKREESFFSLSCSLILLPAGTGMMPSG